ncbi:hypothetical protein Micbo1qcDRAFT_154398 [Microdochium bolleyi]|uniref:Chromo domain-containing protein n=1 Tax=Microdochium bolleyi TaxID=196109 RepID=A0A136IJP0_9PEZI|nr:hypothetical protein Micbo1qcDRAFT_154398 [Microdochium bolleyi]
MARSRRSKPTTTRNNAKHDDDDEGGEKLAEGEYNVEKIKSHRIVKGELNFLVKWEGYEKQTDQTWESENTMENTIAFRDYLKKHRELKIPKHPEKNTKGKKRRRPAISRAVAGKRRRANRRRDGTQPASNEAWKPPAGLWEKKVKEIEAYLDETTGKLIAYLVWKSGQRTQHEMEDIYKRCPQKMLAYYEQLVTIARSAGPALSEPLLLSRR